MIEKGKNSGSRKKTPNALAERRVKPGKAILKKGRLVLAVAFLALLLTAVGGIYRALSHLQRHSSDLEQGLRALKQTYGQTRPLEARIAGFEYSAFENVRGVEKTPDNSRILAHPMPPSRDRAERLLLDAVAENSNAAALAALGKFYLAEKNLDKALAQFENALRLAPEDAQLQNDAGATLLEIGNKAAFADDGAKSLEMFSKSLEHLEQASNLAPQLLEPRFNRALALQKCFLQNQAIAAWREYLETDNNSAWAIEATQNLQMLIGRKPQNLSASELEQQFLAAAGRNDETEAWRLLSGNRELIREKYLPQRLAISHLEAPAAESPEKFLQALVYAGELEKRHLNDSFAADLADYYAKIPKTSLAQLKQAQNSVRDGYRLCLDGEFTAALAEFKRANAIFQQNNDVLEAKLCDYQIVYCTFNANRRRESLALAEQLNAFCQRKNYKWLQANLLYWLAADQRALAQRPQADLNDKRLLALAEEELGDLYMTQKALVALASQSNFVGRKKTALAYLQRAFTAGDAPETSLRQKWRNYSDGIEIMAGGKLYGLAKNAALENIELAKNLQDPLFVIYSQIDAGVVYAQADNLVEAKKWFDAAQQRSQSVGEETERKSLLAHILLYSGNLARKQNDNVQATDFYEQALALTIDAQTPALLYEIEKSRLLALFASDNRRGIEQQIAHTLELAENYRQQILEEQERNSFFDNEQSIYDIAVANEFKNGRYEQAFDYLETSNSRSLLDWLQKGASVQSDRKNVEIIFKQNVKPLTLAEIRGRIPDRTQILQYTVLEDQVLIWLISKNDLTIFSTPIKAQELNEKIEKYLGSLAAQDSDKQIEAQNLGRELYALLIGPVIERLDRTREICIIPQKSLFQVPFAALLSPNDKYFVTEFSFVYASSANVFLICTENARRKTGAAGETLLSVGNPAFDHQVFSELPDLPEAETEARAVADYYDQTEVLCGRNATKTAFRDALPNAEVIHFAGHYFVRQGTPMSSSLVLAKSGDDPDEGVLTNAELALLKLPRTKLVVLSACQTGIERFYNGEGLIGLSRTFLAAGAPLVVASQWAVDSDATAELMKKFHFYRRREKLPTTMALRRAQLDMIESPDGRFRHPYFWAAFAIFGGYAEF